MSRRMVKVEEVSMEESEGNSFTLEGEEEEEDEEETVDVRIEE